MAILVARLALLFLAIALATSRFTLILHEVIGHGGVVKAIGGSIDGYHLYWFAGGFIEFSRTTPYGPVEELAVFLGGIVLEIVLGVIALLVCRATRPGTMLRIVLLAYAAIVLVHAGYYLAAGTFHGFGDGQVLYRQLGANRLYLVLPVALMLLAAAHVLARHLVARVRARLSVSKHAVWLVGAAVLLAGAGHAALSFGELAIRPNPTYRATMQSERMRAIDRDLAVYIRAIEAARGRGPDRDELAQRRHELDRDRTDFPFGRILVGLIAIALLTGAARSGTLSLATGQRGSELALLPWHDLIVPGVLAVTGLALVMVLGIVL